MTLALHVINYVNGFRIWRCRKRFLLVRQIEDDCRLSNVAVKRNRQSIDIRF